MKLEKLRIVLLAIALLAALLSVPRTVRSGRVSAMPSGQMPGGSGIDVISRAAWRAPDGETSPRWIPMYQQPFHIIIHHTDGDPGLNGATASIRNIWYDHAFTLGWGDIGYNYLIDSRGNVYEGRAGGDNVVGAHTQHFNFGSIGIALMGDYQSAKPSQAMISALKRLLIVLANKYGIDPQGSFSEDGKAYPLVGGHRDFNYTLCPGINVYDLLPSIRADISRSVHSSASLGEGETVYVSAGAPSVAQMIVRNTGTTAWNGRFRIRLSAGTLFNLPTAYNVPDVKPGGSITIPLFLPALKTGQVINTGWQLEDMSGKPAGGSFRYTVVALAPNVATPPPSPTPSLTPTPSPALTARPSLTASHTPSPARQSR